MIKKIFVLLFLAISVIASNQFSKKATIKPELVQKGTKKMWCPVCGMSLVHFYKTSHTAITKDGVKRQYCSMRCLLVDLKNHKIDKSSIKVVDVVSQKLIPANKAYYVVGSKIKGTMSRVSKLAFLKKEDALEFIKKYGGKLMNFKEALNIAKQNLKKDLLMVSMKKQKMIYPKGKMIYEKKCKSFKIDFSKFSDINELKASIVKNKLCKIKGKPLQMMSLYLWEVKRVNKLTHKISAPHNAKCPVCGMFVYKYPKWTALIEVNDIHHHKLYFDGVKDMMKFYFKPKNYLNIDFNQKDMQLFVTDYYTLNKIKAKEAYFVIGSNIYGPMGNELIPFSKKSQAKNFIKDHGGKIVEFKDININLLKNLE